MRGLKLKNYKETKIETGSHLIRVRGLKRIIGLVPLTALRVAPYTGAWIETLEVSLLLIISGVAPYTGAWIETFVRAGETPVNRVAPYTGAWIETLFNGK